MATPEEIQEQIDLKEKEILDAQIAETKAEIERTHQSNAVTNATTREPIEYSRPANRDAFAGGPLGTFSRDDRREFEGKPRSTDPEFATETPDKFTFAENAAANGVDPTTGLRPAVRTAVDLLSFAPEAQRDALENEIRNDLGPDFPKHESVLVRDEASGMPAYLRPLAEGGYRWTLVNPPGTDVGDIMSFGAELPTLALDVAGELGGGLAGTAVNPGAGTVAGAVAGAAIGGYLSVPLRIQLAKMAGIPNEIIESIDIHDEAKWQAMMSGGGSLAGHSIVGASTALRNFFGRGLDVDDLPALEAEIKRRQKIIDDTNARGGVELQPSLGQLSGDGDLQVAEATLKGIAIGKTARTLKVADINNHKASAEAMRNMATQEVRSPTDGGFRSVEEISEEVEERLVTNRVDSPMEARSRAQDEVDLFDEQYAAATDRERFIRLQQHSAAQWDEMRRLDAEAWDLHRKVVEWDDVSRTANIGLDNTGPTPIREFMSQLRGDANGALLRTLSEANERTLTSAGFGPAEVKAAMEGGDQTGLASTLLDTRHLHTTLSHLKRTRSAMQANVNPNGFELHDIDGLIKAIEKQMDTGTFRRRSSGRPVRPEKAEQVQLAWENANKSTEMFHATFDSAAMRNLLAVRRVNDGGRISREFDLPPGFIRTRLFAPDDARFLRESMEAVENDPHIRAGLSEELLKQIRKDTIRDGRVQGGLYNEAMGKYEDHMNILFTPEQMGQITNLGSLGRMVDNAGLVAEKLTERLTHHYGRVIADPTNAFNIAEEILGPRMTSKQVKNLMTDLRTLDPRLAASVEEKVMQNIFDKASKADKTTIGFKALDDLLNNQRGSIEAVGGKPYLADLDSLRNSLEIMAEGRFSRAAREELQGLWMRATRLLFGPLGREQRFISAVGRMARARRGGTVNELLRDPTTLRQFVRLKNLSPKDPRFWVGATALGEDVLNIFREAQGGEDNYQQWVDGTLDDRRHKEARVFGEN